MAVVTALLGFGIWSLVIQKLVNGLVGAVVLWQVSNWRPGFSFSRKHFKELFAFGFNILGIRLLSILNRRSDHLLIGYFLGLTALGYYTIAHRLFLEMTELLTRVTSIVAFPVFSRLQTEPERLRRAFYAATQYTSLIAFPAFLGMSAVAPELVAALFGPKWAPSVPVMQVLAFIGIVHSVFYFNSSVTLAAGKPSWRLGLALLNATTNVAAFAVAVRWGIVAVAVAYVVRGYLLSPVEIWIVHKLIKLDIRYYLGQYIGPLVGPVTMAVAVVGLKSVLGGTLRLHWQLVIYGLVGGIVYLLAVQLVVPSSLRRLLEVIRLVLPQWKWRKA